MFNLPRARSRGDLMINKSAAGGSNYLRTLTRARSRGILGVGSVTARRPSTSNDFMIN
jgi:hypothetical protein